MFIVNKYLSKPRNSNIFILTNIKIQNNNNITQFVIKKCINIYSTFSASQKQYL